MRSHNKSNTFSSKHCIHVMGELKFEIYLGWLSTTRTYLSFGNTAEFLFLFSAESANQSSFTCGFFVSPKIIYQQYLPISIWNQQARGKAY